MSLERQGCIFDVGIGGMGVVGFAQEIVCRGVEEFGELCDGSEVRLPVSRFICCICRPCNSQVICYFVLFFALLVAKFP